MKFVLGCILYMLVINIPDNVYADYAAIQWFIDEIRKIFCDKPQSCENGWQQFEDHCYHIPREKATWNGAKKICRELGGHLVKIENRNENEWLKSHVIRKNDTDIFIGLNALEKQNVWRWEADGSLATFFDWHKGEPKEEQCGQYWFYDNLYRFDDASCDIAKPFICEKGQSYFLPFPMRTTTEWALTVLKSYVR